MSRQYAKAAVAALMADPVIAAWATGGILDRDPRRSGANATASFALTPDGDIKPTIAVVGTTAVKPFTRIRGAMQDTIEVRLFVPDYHPEYDGLDTMATRIIRLLSGFHVGNGEPGIFEFEFRLGMQNGGAFEDVAYDEIRLNVMSVYAPLEVS